MDTQESYARLGINPTLLYTAQEIADLWKLNKPDHIYKLVREGHLERLDIGQGSKPVRIVGQSILDYLLRNKK